MKSMVYTAAILMGLSFNAHAADAALSPAANDHDGIRHQEGDHRAPPPPVHDGDEAARPPPPPGSEVSGNQDHHGPPPHEGHGPPHHGDHPHGAPPGEPPVVDVDE